MKFEQKELTQTANTSSGDQSLKRAGLVLGFGLAAVVLGYFSLFALSPYIAKKIPDQWEKKLTWESKDSDVDSPSVPLEIKKEWQAALRVFEGIKKNRTLRNLNYKLRYLDSEEQNAFAIPGGSIFLTRGFLESVKGTAGVAFVLGHELGHHEHRHVLEKTLMLTLNTFLGIFTGTSKVSDSALSFAVLTFSRENEIQADRYGVKVVRDIYGTSKGADEFFQSVKSNDPSGLMKWFSTHPMNTDRIELLNKSDSGL